MLSYFLVVNDSHNISILWCDENVLPPHPPVDNLHKLKHWKAAIIFKASGNRSSAMKFYQMVTKVWFSLLISGVPGHMACSKGNLLECFRILHALRYLYTLPPSSAAPSLVGLGRVTYPSGHQSFSKYRGVVSFGNYYMPLGFQEHNMPKSFLSVNMQIWLQWLETCW